MKGCIRVPERLVIIGAGGFGREAAWLAGSLPDSWDLVGFVDDNDAVQGATISGLPVLGRLSEIERYADTWMVVAVGSPRIRKKIVERLLELGRTQFATLIHPSAHVNKFSCIGEGSIVIAGAFISDKTVLGRHCICNVNSAVGHDTVIGDFSTIAGHVDICGNVSIGRGSEFGAGSVVVPGVEVGAGSLCCAGSVVANKVAPGAVVAGNPARRVKDLPEFDE